MAQNAVADYAAYELLLGYLPPADHANLRLVSRSWQALVDRSLGCLYPCSITPCNFGFGSATSLVYKSLFQSNIIRHHALDSRPLNGFHAIARQFTALHTLAVDCISRNCDDFEHLHLIHGLRRLKLSQFEFTEEAFEFGIASCRGLQVLHLQSQQALLQLRSLRHMAGLLELQELVLAPRAYTNVPAEAVAGIAALGGLTKLTQLVLTTALKPPRSSFNNGHSTNNDDINLDQSMQSLSNATAGRPVYFDAPTTAQLSSSLSMMKGLQVLRIAAPATMPAAIGGLTQLKQLSLERVAHLNRAAVTSLLNLKQLTALTIITAAEPPGGYLQQQQQWLQDPAAAAVAGFGQHQQQDQLDPAAIDPAAGFGYLSASSSSSSSGSDDGLFLPLMQLPNLQEIVVGCIARGQTLNLSTTLTHDLQPPACQEAGTYPGLSGTSPQGLGPRQSPRGLGLEHHGRQGSRGQYGVVQRQQVISGSRSQSDQGLAAQQSSGQQGFGHQQEWFYQGFGGERYLLEDGEATNAYVCPDQWSQLSEMQGLHHVVVEARGWHSAAVTARYNSLTDAVSSMMTWPAVGPLDLCSVASSSSSGGRPMFAGLLPQPHRDASLLSGLVQMVGGDRSHSKGSSTAPFRSQITAAGSQISDQSQNRSDLARSAGAVGVFINHPSQQGYLPGLPQLLVLALRPAMSRLGASQRRLVHQHLLAVQRAGSHASQQQLLLGGTVPLPESPARQLLLAQLRASMHPSKLLIVLAASALHIRRLEVTVDQSWPHAVLSSLGHLHKLPHLEILKLDCGRQDPPPEMWSGLASLTNLRWLCLRWLEGLPVSCLAGMSKLVVLQLKAITNPPGAAELAEVMAGMPHLQALAVEGGLLDVEGDWLRDTAGLLRHGRWTSSWVEHTLCRQQRLRVLGSITAALLLAITLNSPKLPEMIITALLAMISGTIFVLAVAASLVSLMLDPAGPAAAAAANEAAAAASYAGFSWQQLQQQASGLLAAAASGAGAAAAAAAAEPGSSSGSSDALIAGSNQGWNINLMRQVVWLSVRWGWWIYSWCVFWPLWLGLAIGRRCWHYYCSRYLPAPDSSSDSTAAAAAAYGAADLPQLEDVQQQRVSEVVADDQQQPESCSAITPGGTAAAAAAASGYSSAAAGGGGGVSDPGAAFRRLRYFSLRRCTLTSRTRTALIRNQPWQLTTLMTQLPPGLTSQAVAALLGLLLWPLAALGALSRIVANSTYQAAGATGGIWSGLGGFGAIGLRLQGSASSASGGTSSNPSRRGRGLFAGWGWYWDELCGLLQAAANKVEVAAVGHGSALLGLLSEMPNLRFLDVTWLNLDPWELHALVQLRHLHYLGLGKQQIGLVMSAEAQLARNLQRGWRGRGRRSNRRRRGLSGALGGLDSLLITPFLWLRWCWFAGPWTWWHNTYGTGNQGHNTGNAGHEAANWAVHGGQGFGPGPIQGFGPGPSQGFGSSPSQGFSRDLDMCMWLDDGGSSMVIVDAPAGFDEVLERDISTGQG